MPTVKGQSLSNRAKAISATLLTAIILILSATSTSAQDPIGRPAPPRPAREENRRPAANPTHSKPAPAPAQAQETTPAPTPQRTVVETVEPVRENTANLQSRPAPSEPEPDNTHGFYGKYEWVDLGLPSGLKWATCNVGASRPELFGDYFAWGEPSSKIKYEDNNCKTYKKSISWLNDNGYLDSNGNLTILYDAPRQQWGHPWRMPTANDFRELISNTIPEWTTVCGINGWTFRSRVNGNSIFLPVAGWKKGSSLSYAGEEGRYWSSTPDSSDAAIAFDFYLYLGHFSVDSSKRHRGRPIRPVAE